MRTHEIRGDSSDGRPSAVEVPLRGHALLSHPMYNKGTAFTLQERKAFGLEGLLPPGVNSIEEQSRRTAASMLRKEDPLERYIGLAALQDRNEHLFYRVLLDHLEEFLPIVYTPTVGLACQNFSHIFRRARGLWITPDDQGRIRELLANAAGDDVRLIVATDNERILGLGDQGAGGMGIPVGKLALYTVAAGIHPAQALPVSLDVGTDNRELLEDPLYLGWRQRRLRGERYAQVMDEFVRGVMSCFPRALLQWEDFKKQNALSLLDRYRHTLPSFNDDIQGTAAVAVACIFSALRVTGIPMAAQRVVIAGAGAAGIGIARQIRESMRREGLEGDDLTRAVAVTDRKGLLVEGRELTEDYKREFAWPASLVERCGLSPAGGCGLRELMETLKPTILIGSSGQPGIFDETLIRTMASHVERPVVFPFSNPTSKAEATPREILSWTGGRALVATGSPFPPVRHGTREIRVSQGNNVYVFPGIGLGALVARAREVSEKMFTVAARTLADLVTPGDLETGALLPPIRELRAISARIAEAVALEARDSGRGEDCSGETITRRLQAEMWSPVYPKYKPT